MRDLSSTQLTATQKKAGVKPAVRVVLVSADEETTYTFYNTSGDHRIVAMEHKESAFAASATIYLDNRDKYFSTLSLYGYTATISWGLKTPAGLEYSATAPLHVTVQNLDSSPGRLYCSLYCLGEMSMLAEDKADESFLPTTETIKDLIEGTLKGEADGGLTPFDDCPEYEYEFDTGYDDDLIDAFVPEESVRVSIGTSRLAFIRRLIDFTNDVIRYEADGKFHILLPTTSGSTYDYEYEFPLADEHVFLTKTQMERLTIPNFVKVWNDDYASEADHGIPDADADDSFARRPVILPIKLQNIADVAEANALADAIFTKLAMNAKSAEVVVPMNCGQEIWDYVKITDAREGTTQTGNVGAITRHYGAGQYNMTIKLGGWTTMKEFASKWEVYGGGGDDISYPPVAWPLEVDWMWIKTLYFSTLVAAAGGSAIDIIRDEDDMDSNDENALATQQSIKKYVDDNAPSWEHVTITDDAVTIENEYNLFLKEDATHYGALRYETASDFTRLLSTHGLELYSDTDNLELRGLTASQGIVTGSRAVDTDYQNSGHAPLLVTVVGGQIITGSIILTAFCDATQANVTAQDIDYRVAQATSGAEVGGMLSITFIVPIGYWYRVDLTVGALLVWTEWEIGQ